MLFPLLKKRGARFREQEGLEHIYIYIPPPLSWRWDSSVFQMCSIMTSLRWQNIPKGGRTHEEVRAQGMLTGWLTIKTRGVSTLG